MPNILGSIITAGVAIIAIAMLTVVAGQTIVSLPQFAANETPWVNITEEVSTNAGIAFSLLGIAPLVLGAAVIITIIIGAFVFTRR